MAQTAYTGIQGSGKSYEVVRGVILPNVAKGRRIVTNVAGLQVDKINAYCVDKLGADPEHLGEIVTIKNEQVTEKNFFPVENQDNSGCVVQGGDIVVLDECWRWYVTGEKLPDGHLTFFRMHRHFTHPETGQSCDIVLIVQAIDDLQRKVRATVEKSYLMKKHKDLGFSDRYLVSIFSGNRQTKTALTESFQGKYDPEVFALYTSYSQSKATANKEEQADKRGNVFNRGGIKYGLPLAVIGICAGIWKGWAFFHPEATAKPVEQAQSQPGGTSEGQQAKPEVPGLSSTWRLAGSLQRDGRVAFVLVDGAGRVRYVDDPPAYKVSTHEVELALPNGEFVTRWSGPMPATVAAGAVSDRLKARR